MATIYRLRVTKIENLSGPNREGELLLCLNSLDMISIQGGVVDIHCIVKCGARYAVCVREIT